MTAAELPTYALCRVTHGAGVLPDGALAERYGSTVIWSLGERHGRRQVDRCRGVVFGLDRDVLRLRAGVYRLKAEAAEGRAGA